MVRISTTALLQEKKDEALLHTCAVHELQHLMTLEDLYVEGAVEEYFSKGTGEAAYLQSYAEAMVLTEVFTAAAEEMIYPGSSVRHMLPYWYEGDPDWYEGTADWADLTAAGGDCCLRSKEIDKQCGKDLFRWQYTPTDYGVVILLAHFIENRGGTEAFAGIIERWQEMGCVGDPIQAIWESLGYEHYQTFFEDFLLSVLLHNDEYADGRFRLDPFPGCEGDPFQYLVPIVTETQLYLEAGGYTVIRPAGGVYTPPATANPGLGYVGVTIPSTGGEK